MTWNSDYNKRGYPWLLHNAWINCELLAIKYYELLMLDTAVSNPMWGSLGVGMGLKGTAGLILVFNCTTPYLIPYSDFVVSYRSWYSDNTDWHCFDGVTRLRFAKNFLLSRVLRWLQKKVFGYEVAHLRALVFSDWYQDYNFACDAV